MKIKTILFVAALIACYACEPKTEVKNEPVREDHLAKANDYFMKADFEKAITEFDLSIKDSATAGAFYGKGVIFDLGGNYQSAIEFFSKAIESDPAFTLAYYKRANSKRMVGDQSALADLKKAVELKPDFVSAIVDVAHMEAPQGKVEKTIIDMLSQSIQAQPNSYFLYNYRGIQRYHSGDNKGAMEDFDQVIKLDSSAAEAYYYRGIINGEAKEYAKSVADLSKAISLKSDYKTAYLYRGIYNYNLEKKEDACKDFAKAKELGEATAQKYIADLCGAK